MPELVKWSVVAATLVNRLVAYRGHTNREILQCVFSMVNVGRLRTEGTSAQYYNMTDMDWVELAQSLETQHGYLLVRMGHEIGIVKTSRPQNWVHLSFKGRFNETALSGEGDDHETS